MKNFGLLMLSGFLLGLSGTSCENQANSDLSYAVEVSGLSGSSAAHGHRSGSAPFQAGSTNAAAGNSRDSKAGTGRPLDNEPATDSPPEGEREMAALAGAYPQQIQDLAFRGGDWAVRIDDAWYYWAKGRLLPEELRDRWEEYASYRFYSYSLDLPRIPELDEEAKQQMKNRLARAEENPPRRHEGFLADLYQAATRGQTEARIVTVKLMGFEVRVHEQIAEPLKAVDRDLEALVKTDPGAQRFVAGLKGLAGYNWREIAGTRSRSYHSYGIAVDLAPKSFGGKHTYWRWALPQTEEFYAIPYERRWMVPQQIVEIFEKRGFIWGGKWFFFDTMHFEYRPEILILAESSVTR